MKKVLVSLILSVLISGLHVAAASATLWTGSLTNGAGTTYHNVRELDWEKVSVYANNLDFKFDGKLVGAHDTAGLPLPGSYDPAFTIHAEIKGNGSTTDDVFRIMYGSTILAQGTLDQDSYTAGTFTIRGTTTNDYGYFAPSVLGLNFGLRGSVTLSPFDPTLSSISDTHSFFDETATVPEPSSLLLAGVGLGMAAIFCRKRNRSKE